MRRFLLALALLTLVALPMAAQNTDIESLSGLQFNFGNPGARSLGMGGAFLGLADDASAAEANPAGLTILRKPEISIEGRNYLEEQLFTTTGTFPDVTRTAFNHYSRRAELTFASAVYPIGNFTIGAYFHEPLRNEGAGQVLPTRNEITGQIKTDVPNFFLPKGGTPVTQAQCNQIKQQKGDPFACLEYTVLPFISALDVQEQTYGLAGAWKIGNFSVGGAARYQRFKEGAFTFRVTPTLDFSSISVQATGDIVNNEIVQKQEHDITYSAGFKWAPIDKFSVGGVFKKGAKFKAPTFAATSDTNLVFQKVGDTTFHIPDIYGAGVSYRPIPVLTLNADAVRVKYSNLVDNFISVNETIRSLDKAYKANDVTEIHAGAEYFFGTKIPFALRAGWWRDPAHSVTFTGPLTTPDAVAAAILYPKGTSQNHKSVGAGLAWPKFQIDAAYDTSKYFKVGSLSAVMRF
jgi:long-subunit fatty acid transport protein